MTICMREIRLPPLNGLTELQTIQSLDTFPEQGAIIPEASLDASFADLHQIFYTMNAGGNTYRIIYKITNDTCKIVDVVTIRSAYQQPMA